MKLVLNGFENSLKISSGELSILRLESVTLFSRIVQSLFSAEPATCLEPFSLWDAEGKELRPKDYFLPLLNPFDLPWDDKGLTSSLFRNFEMLIKEDEVLRTELELLSARCEQLVCEASLGLRGSYGLGLQWSLARFLKSQAFGVDRSDAIMPLDNLIRFIELLKDSQCKKILVFMNLEKFLTQEELLELENQLFFHNLPALLLMQGSCAIATKRGHELFVDQDFLEFIK